MFAALLGRGDARMYTIRHHNRSGKGVSTKVLTHRKLAIMFAALRNPEQRRKALKREAKD